MLKTINEVSLARDLVRCQSVTPKDDGAINVVAKNLKKLGFKCQIMEFPLRMILLQDYASKYQIHHTVAMIE